MELIADDREHAIIAYLSRLTDIKIERITVGDYVFIYEGKIIAIIERKTLADLAASIKDGRMENNNKLLEAQRKSNCQIIYIIEGPLCSNMKKKIGRIPYKCLQGKIDSLMFKSGAKIICTKDYKHTAERLSGLCVTFTTMANDGVFGEVKAGNKSLIKQKHIIHPDIIRLHMLLKIPKIGHATATTVMKKYSIRQILNNHISEPEYYNLCYLSSGHRLGPRGKEMYNKCLHLHKSIDIQIKMLCCISGISPDAAKAILLKVPFEKIVSSDFKGGDIANIKKSEKRRIGISIENKLRVIFSEKPNDQNLEELKQH